MIDIFNVIKKIKKRWVVFATAGILLFLLIGTKNTNTKVDRYSQFSTTKPSSEPEAQQHNLTQEELKNLVEGDLEYSKKVEIFKQKYPWYNKIPIERDSYTIVYDYDISSFRIRLKMKQTSPESQRNEAVNKALKDISDIGGDVTNYYILFTEE